MSNSGLRGTTAAQDTRFANKESKALRGTKFPIEFDQKVDVRKVNLSIMRPWIAKTVTELSGVEDDIVIEYAMELLEDPEKPIPDPKKMQISLVGFLDKNAPEFMLRLWKLLISAQTSPGGVPAEFIEAKKAEMLAQREADALMQQKMLGRGEQGGGTRIHAQFPDNRQQNQNQNTRYDRGNVPRDRDGRAFPRGQGVDPYGPRGGDNGYGSRGRGGRMRGNRADRYDYGGAPDRGYENRRAGPGGRDRSPPRRYFNRDDSRDRQGDRGHDDRRDDDGRRRDGRGTETSRDQGMRGSDSNEKRRNSSPSPDRSRSRTPRHRETTPKRARSPSPSRSRTPPRKRAREHSSSQSRSRSRSPIRRRPRPVSRSRSRTPPSRKVATRSPSRRAPLPAGRSRSRSRSRSPVGRAPLPRDRNMSPEPRRRRRSPSSASSRSRSRSRSRNGSTPPRRRVADRSPPTRRRQASPSRSRSPVSP